MTRIAHERSTQPAKAVMAAAVLVEPRRVVLREAAMPEPGPGEVRLRLEGCGVCASNIPPWEGRAWFTYPFPDGAPGHEAWGTIDAVGADVSDLSIGQRVAALSQHAYAAYDIAAADDVVVLPDDMDGQAFPGEPLGCAMNIFARSDVQAGQATAIIGMGFLGNLLGQLCVKAGGEAIAISVRESSLAMAQRMDAAHHAIPFDERWAVVERVKQATRGALCPRVIECTGTQAGLDLAGDITAERGRLVIAGYHQDGLRQVNMQSWNWKGIDVINAHERDPRKYVNGMYQAVQAVRSGRLRVAPLLTHALPLSKLGEALELARTRPAGFLKAMVTMPTGT